MKRKIILITILILLLVGCSKNLTVKEATSDYLNRYINLDESIIEQLNTQASRYYKNNSVKDKYIDVLKRQYSNLEYEIVNETYDNEFAYTNIKIMVYDLYKAQKNATENINDFLLPDGNYDMDAFNLYKLDKMLTTENKVENTITIKLLREDNTWEVLQLSNENLEKLHGIYNYEA